MNTTKKPLGCFIKGCYTLLKIYLLIFVLYWGFRFLRVQYMTWYFKTNGGASVFRNACLKLKPALQESPEKFLSFSKQKFPSEYPMCKLHPQFLSYHETHGTGINMYVIGITSGFYYSGYIIFESIDNMPSQITLGPPGTIITDIGDGVFIYQGNN